MNATWLLLGACLLASACDPSCGPTCAELASAPPPTVTLAQDGDAFAALEDGDVVELHFGNQGGQHVELGARITGLQHGTGRLRDDCNPRVDFEVQVAAGDTGLGDGWYPSPGLFRPTGGAEAEAQWLDQVVPVGWSVGPGMELDVSVTVSDVCGRTASDAATVRIR